VSDVNVPVLDYTWEWFNGADIRNAAPFRYVFPQFRLNANVNEHPRGALYAFMEGALLNLIPGNMRSYRLRDCPELVALLRQLTPLRQRFLPYFTEGQYRFVEGLTVNGGEARLYTDEDKILVIAINPSDEPSDVTITVDPAVWGASLIRGTIASFDLDAEEVERTQGEQSAFQRTVRLDPDSMHIFEFRPEE
jgi:HSP20 family molecular chaperone IbpA